MTLDKRIDRIEKTLDTIQNNHLAHLNKDMVLVKRFVIGAAIGVVVNLGVVLTTII